MASLCTLAQRQYFIWSNLKQLFLMFRIAFRVFLQFQCLHFLQQLGCPNYLCQTHSKSLRKSTTSPLITHLFHHGNTQIITEGVSQLKHSWLLVFPELRYWRQHPGLPSHDATSTECHPQYHLPGKTRSVQVRESTYIISRWSERSFYNEIERCWPNEFNTTDSYRFQQCEPLREATCHTRVVAHIYRWKLVGRVSRRVVKRTHKANQANSGSSKKHKLQQDGSRRHARTTRGKHVC